MTVPLYGVDAFTSTAFGGNPAAVCLLDGPAEPGWMQQVAAELGRPTTAFTHLRPDGGRQLRWFTPATELPLCGHATLATAHVLHETRRAGSARALSFATPAGMLTVDRRDGLLWLNLPAVALTAAPAPLPLLAALGVEARHVTWFGQNGYEYVAVLDSAERVEQLHPHIGRVSELPVTRTIATAAGGDGADFTSRVFVPAIGLDEDAVTGSAHATLGPLWARRLGRTQLSAVQASCRRGQLTLTVDEHRVHIGGTAVITTRGELLTLPINRVK